MFITELKPIAEILELTGKAKCKVLLIQCDGCRELYLPSVDIDKFKQELKNNPDITIIDDIKSDYLCNQEYTKTRISNYWKEKIDSTDIIMVFSCGVGPQVLSLFINKQILPGLNTMAMDGFTGLTLSEYECAQCGDCVLSMTGGICPITACSKSLLNGPCGGAKNGKCEVSKDMPCGWERIIKRLESINQVENIKQAVKLRDYTKVL